MTQELKTGIKDFITNYVKSATGKEEVSSTANLATDLGLDSLDAVELIMECEKEYNIAIPDEDAEKLNTIDEITEFVYSNVLKNG